MEQAEISFSDEFTYLHAAIKQLNNIKDDWRFPLVPTEIFKESDDLVVAAEIYWKEMLYRIHAATTVSLFRAARWIDGMQAAREAGIYYSFAVNLRGFVESCSDTFYTMRQVPLTIAKDFHAIKKSLTGETEIIVAHEPLEEILLHFSHASKIPKAQQKTLPEYMNAKQVREYLNAIVDVNDQIDTLYSYLCQVSHPAAESNAIFLFHYENDLIVCGDSYMMEIDLINGLIDTFGNAIQDIFRLICRNGFQCFKLLNLFELDEIFTNHPLIDNIIKSQAWDDVKGFIADSEQLYLDGITNGRY
ncbi:hypothetical protein [Mucilaginibacter aquaedulcis]|uniref:hypothetical protein n=1 Tax=Mucilaginibacter aquaedulcis TaxID=1187081 RepID=UPI0025B37A5D|nr:hypothetical protein [Mucilaginibacter aquaedulcis]MDN3551007.1 hypothetical protein [Mucilaginibacter aquaedulcis]